MGIVRFFYWFKTNFNKDIKNLKKYQTFKDIDTNIDNLMIDMNGLFHNSAQKVFKYGNHKLPTRLLNNRNKSKYPYYNKRNKIKLFEDVCNEIDNLVRISIPKKRIILCVDGPAPLSKQSQQRKRRFRSAKDRDDELTFDSNCITPGTEFMDHLNKYVDWYIRKKVSENKNWKDLEIIFSNDRVPGEGEHKLINYIRKYGDKQETYCINGLDADLIMLTLGTHCPNFYILREDMYDRGNDFFCINMGKIRDELSKMLSWESDNFKFDNKDCVNDFIFLCFFVGNDFLPHIPLVEIIRDGLELLIDLYKKVCKDFGHITRLEDKRIRFNKKPLKAYLQLLGQQEKDLLENKLNSKRSYFPDKLVDECSKQIGTKWQVDINEYKGKYCKKGFGENNLEQVCHEYLQGMQWIITYYINGVSDWRWKFNYNYAPFASTLSKYIDTFEYKEHIRDNPTLPFEQLVSVLPPRSANLIPYPLKNLLLDKNSSFQKFCPDEIEIDLAGKQREWEGIVLIPHINFNIIKDEFNSLLLKVNNKENKRNCFGKTFVYNYSNFSTYYNSYYGDINESRVKITYISI